MCRPLQIREKCTQREWNAPLGSLSQKKRRIGQTFYVEILETACDVAVERASGAAAEQGPSPILAPRGDALRTDQGYRGRPPRFAAVVKNFSRAACQRLF
jgi:hypothetical protein